MADLPRLPTEADPDETSNSLAVQDDNKDAVFADILETLHSNNFLLDEIEENTEDDESITEKRNRRVEEENTDKPGVFSKAIGGLGAGIKGVGGILNKANPFQEGGLGPKMSILLISGVLFAISKFGDKLVKPLASLLEMIDSEGGVLDKLKDTELFKSAMETFEKFKERAKLIGEDVKKLLEAATNVGSLIKSAYESVVAYISSFDTRGAGPAGQYADGKLDALEMQNLKDDLMKKAQDLVTNIIGTVWNEISFATKLLFAAGGAVSLLLQASLVARIAKIIAGVSGKPPSADGPKTRSSRGGIIKNLARSLVVGTSAFSSVGNTTRVASLKPGQAINKAGSIYSTKTGRIVKPAVSFTHLSKYPRLLTAAKRIPILTPILTGAFAIKTMKDDSLSKDEKIAELGGILGGGLGAMGFGALGASLGLTLGPAGSIIGALLGSLTGFYGGEALGKMLAGFLLGKDRDPIDIGSMNTSTLGASNAPPGNLNIDSAPLTMDAQLRETDAARAQRHALEQYRMSTMPSTSGATVSKLSNTTESNGDSSALPLTVPVLVDQKEINNINSSYSGSPSSSNGFQPARLFGDSLLIDWRSM